MSESSRKATISGGIMKKGIRRRVCTRNRSKVEKIRESLKHLKIEEKQIKPTRNKVSRGDPSSRDSFHDCDWDIRIGDQEVSVQLHNLQFPLEGSLNRHSCLKRKVENSPVNSESLNHSRSERSKAKICESSGSRPGMLERKGKPRDQLEKRYSDWNGDSQTSKSYCSMSETVGFVEDTRKSDSDKDQCSFSPPNSPLYDMPPPSTPAQKQERRAKRLLQLERWKKCETSRLRQERYQRRAQEEAETMQKSVSMHSRRVQWSHDLVQTVYIDDPDDKPNLIDSPMV